jgi:hypothetical protein
MTTKTIGLWLDTEGGRDNARWIVSEDTQEGGETTSSRTLAIFDEDDYQTARSNALAIGRRNHLAVIETPEMEGPSRCIHSPAI